MKIGIDASRAVTKESTGTENYSFNLIRALEKIDLKNEYWLYFNQPPSLPIVINSNFTTKVMRFPRFWTQARLALEVLQNPPDLLFIPAHTLPIIRRPNLKTVVTIHDLGSEFLKEYHEFPQKLYLNSSTRYAAKFATQLISVSKSTKKDLMEKLQVPEERITVVYEGVDKSFFKPIEDQKVQQIKKKYHLQGDYLLFVGTIQPRKNLLRLIEAFNNLLKNPSFQKLSLVLVGKEGWLADDIYTAPIDLKLQDRVRFLNYVPAYDLPALYSGAKIFLLPSLYEGFGLPVIEAMSCGVPVITSGVSSLPEVAGDAALQVNPYHTEEIAQAIEKILTNPSLAKTLVKKGLVQAKKFAWEKTAQETLTVFEKVWKS